MELLSPLPPVPQGFVLTVDAYRRNVDTTLAAEIDALIAGHDERSDNRAVAEKIRERFIARGLDADIDAAIRVAYADLLYSQHDAVIDFLFASGQDLRASVARLTTDLR